MFNQYRKTNTQDQKKDTNNKDKNLKLKENVEPKELGLSYKQWIGKVHGTPELIKEAIEKLGRQPKDDVELHNFIFREYKGKAILEVLEEADKQSQYAPY